LSWSGQRPSTRDLRAAIFEEAVAIMRAELGRRLALEELSRRVATSPRQLRRAFSETAGTGFRSYLARLRMEEAARLLTTTDLPVRVVGRRVGYRQAGQFTKAFKRTHGTTPSQFRAERRMEHEE
jgi:AraC family transcriptional regulator of adaptative response / methylphosphotriester-DNA alkyltransferase methyltransferase